MHFPLSPHGGQLINRVVSGNERETLLAKVGKIPQIILGEREMSDLDMIACGALSPLEGFMGQADYQSVVEKMRLSNGLPWSLPVMLSAKKSDADTYEVGSEIALLAPDKTPLAILQLKEKFDYNKENEAEKVYKTKEAAHPGVAALYAQNEIYLAGPVQVLNRVKYEEFLNYRQDPLELRKLFQEKGWKTIVGFQTRNPIHRAHEYIQKCALEIVDGLLIHPLVGATKSDDIPAAVRMKCYEALLKNYFPLNRTHLSVFPAAMRYAGPREAIFHAIARKNYGCTHFIVGRDHAGVGNYYGTYEAQELFDRFEIEELGIIPLKFENAFFCKRTLSMATAKTSPSTPEEQINLSGTKVREMLRAGQLPPPEFSRPEVAQILIDAMKA